MVDQIIEAITNEAIGTRVFIIAWTVLIYSIVQFRKIWSE